MLAETPGLCARLLDHRVFFAVQPDELTCARLVRFTDRLRQEEGVRGRPIEGRRLHVTLGMLGRWSEAPPEDAIDLAKAIAAQVRLRPFKVAFGRVQSWRASHGPLVLVGDDEQSIGLRWLHDALHEAYGQTPDPGFVPHISLIWSPDPLGERRVEPFGWMVREFVLVHSVYGRSRHEVLGRWPLKNDGSSR